MSKKEVSCRSSQASHIPLHTSTSNPILDSTRHPNLAWRASFFIHNSKRLRFTAKRDVAKQSSRDGLRAGIKRSGEDLDQG